jgi:phage shock protein PspC (stress-responsive transcriptional regulator)
MQLAKYNKFIIAAVLGVVAILANLYGADSSVVTTVTAIATALGVYIVPNKSE